MAIFEFVTYVTSSFKRLSASYGPGFIWDFCYNDLIYVIQTFILHCQMPNKLRSIWTFYFSDFAISISIWIWSQCRLFGKKGAHGMNKRLRNTQSICSTLTVMLFQLMHLQTSINNKIIAIFIQINVQKWKKTKYPKGTQHWKNFFIMIVKF